MKIPKLLEASLIVASIYAAFRIIFDVILEQLIPSSLLSMYMFFIVTGVFMVYTATEEGVRELTAPIKALMEDPEKKRARFVLFIMLPLFVCSLTYFKVLPDFEAPPELRTVHPAPPSSFKAFGKRFNPATMENPLRENEKKDPELFRELVMEGGVIYSENCHFCHGDKLDGQGPYAAALNPFPTNFRDVGTIAQLQESYLFWRISTGGPGLPDEAASWNSSMPAWENFLSEEEIWKVILFLYDYTGNEPRLWSNKHAMKGKPQ